MTRQVNERTVHVWAIPHVVTVYQKSKTVWAAVGDYLGERIEVEGVPMSQPNGSRRLALGAIDVRRNPPRLVFGEQLGEAIKAH
jgi:hypothetical protein